MTEGILEASGDLIHLGEGGPLAATGERLAHHRFEASARAHPDRIAVVSNDEKLTYAQFDARAEAISRRLRAAGVGRETVVGICLPRRLDVLVTVFAVMKSGGAYLPLDLVQPLERRRFMLEDAGATTLVTIPTWESELND